MIVQFFKKIIILPKSSCKLIFLLRHAKFDYQKQNKTPQQVQYSLSKSPNMGDFLY